MQECNPPRNNQLETHPDDERGRWPPGQRLRRMDRFPDALENSSKKLPQSGILFVSGFEFRRRQVAEGGVKAFLVVDLFKKLRDAGTGLAQVAILVAINLLV